MTEFLRRLLFEGGPVGVVAYIIIVAAISGVASMLFALLILLVIR